MILKLAQWSFLFLVFSLPLTRPFNVSVGGSTYPYTDLIFPLVFALVVLTICLKQLRPRFDRVLLFVGLFALSLTIAVFQPRADPLKLLGEFYLFALCWIAFILCSDESFCRMVVIAWLGGTAIATLAAIVGAGLFYAGFKTQEANYFLSHLGSLPAGDYPRVQGLFANPNMFCNYLNVSVCFLLVATKVTRIPRWLVWALSAATLCAAVLTLSPGLGGIALSVGLLLGSGTTGLNTALQRTSIVAGVLLAVLMLGVMLISPATGNTTVIKTLPLTERRVEPSVRVLVWKNVIERTAPHLPLGQGTGAATADLPYTQLSGEQQVLADAHNMYLNVFGQAGLVGLVAFLILVVVLTRRAKIHTADPFLLSASCAFVGAFLYQGLTGSFEDARHLWVLIGFLIAVSKRDPDVTGDDTSLASIEL